MLNITFAQSIKHDLDYYYGKPTFCKITITDVQDLKYETEFHLPQGWIHTKFTDLLAQAFHLCDNIPESVHINELYRDVKNLN